jgi:hypothetical protein
MKGAGSLRNYNVENDSTRGLIYDLHVSPIRARITLATDHLVNVGESSVIRSNEVLQTLGEHPQ